MPRYSIFLIDIIGIKEYLLLGSTDEVQSPVYGMHAATDTVCDPIHILSRVYEYIDRYLHHVKVEEHDMYIRMYPYDMK